MLRVILKVVTPLVDGGGAAHGIYGCTELRIFTLDIHNLTTYSVTHVHRRASPDGVATSVSTADWMVVSEGCS